MSRQTTARGETMSRKADAVIIGAGVIGANIAYELARKGYKTLNIDKLPASGYGPTSASCAIVRAHYSSWDGVAMAYEGFFYWKDWADYLGVEDESGLARYMNCGTLLLESATGHHEKVLNHYRDVGVEYEEWTTDQLLERMPIFDPHAFYPPKRPEDPHFWDQSEEELPGAVYTPGSGYVNDPQLASHNLQRAAEAHGGEFLFRSTVMDIRRDNGRVAGVTLGDGLEIDAPIVVNVAGPHSDIVNEMAGATEDMKVRTKPLRHEVHHVPAPPDFDYDTDGVHCSDGDTGIYFRPESGTTSSSAPRTRTATSASGSPIPTTTSATSPRRSGRRRSTASRAGSRRCASRTSARRRRPLRLLGRLDPDLRQVRRRRLLHGDRDERQPVQERAGRRACHGRADRPRRERPRPRRRPGQGEVPLHRPRARHGLLLAPPRDQPELELLGERVA